MIRCVDDVCIFIELLVLQLIENLTDHIIHTGDHTIISGNRPAQHILCHFPKYIGGLPLLHRRMNIAIWELCIVGHQNAIGIVHIEIFLRYAIRPVGIQITDIKHPGGIQCSLPLFPQIRQRLICHLAVVTIESQLLPVINLCDISPTRFEQKSPTGWPRISRKARDKRHFSRIGIPCRSVNRFIKVCKSRVVIVNSTSGVDFAYTSRFNTILIQSGCPGLLFLFFGQRHTIRPAINLVNVLPRHKTHATGTAHRTIGIRPCKMCAFTRKAIQIGRLDKWVLPISHHCRVMLIAAYN